MTPRTVVVVLALLVAFIAGCRGRPDPVHELEDRLLSPCCWRQSLRDHESPMANALRAEITERLGRGEAAAAIEEDLVQRYGERIRALPSGGDPRWIIGVVAGVAALAGLVVLARLAAWRRRSARVATAAAGAPAALDPDDEDRLDDELALVGD